MKNDCWLVYLLECCDGKYYCGITTDMERRLAEHNGGLPGGARFTSGRRPVILLASAQVADRSAALKLERMVKRQPKARKLATLLRGLEQDSQGSK